MAFVGLLVGAGFATGKEVIQYFISFGLWGIVGAVIAGIIMATAGAVILQLGSYFLADEHNMVFRRISHPVASKLLDASVTITLFAVGFVMLAGAGANLDQQFGVPSWIGALIMTLVVMAVGILDVTKVSNVIGLLTPTIIIAVLVAFVYTLFNMPADTSVLNDIAQQSDSPVKPWILSALNYNGLALLLGVSMSLVIGGNYTSTRSAGLGGLVGGGIYLVMLFIAAVTLYLNIEEVADADVPMLYLLDDMHPAAGIIMAIIIFLMIFNTAIGMFYALGKRLSVGRESKFLPIFWAVCLVGYAVSFVGFDTLMVYVYPVIGWIGLVMVVLLSAWWIKHRGELSQESDRRDRIRELSVAHEEARHDADADGLTPEEQHELDQHYEESNIDAEVLKESIAGEVADELNLDSDGEGAAEQAGEDTAESTSR